MMRRRMRRRAVVGVVAATAATAHVTNKRANERHDQEMADADQQAQVEDLQAQVDDLQSQQVQQAVAPAPQPAAAPAAAANDPIAEIKRLGDLNAAGLLTDEEFAAAKAKILGI